MPVCGPGFLMDRLSWTPIGPFLENSAVFLTRRTPRHKPRQPDQ